MICSNCGGTINGLVKFCPHCGKEQTYTEAKSIYVQGIDLFERGNTNGAKELFEKADSLCFPPATNMVGVCVEMNVMGNYSNCVQYYERAARNGSIAGMANLGRCQWTIQPTNDKTILDNNTEYWLLQAAERGFTEAMISLAVFYSHKKNVNEYARKIYKLVSTAANLGNIKGKQLKTIVDNGTYDSLDRRGVDGVVNFEYQSDASNKFKDIDLDAWQRNDKPQELFSDDDHIFNSAYQNNINKKDNGNTGISFNSAISKAKNVSEGALQGAKIGSTIPIVGTKAGAIIGGLLGGLFGSKK